jgi:membrane protein DedA with SNARE-associated domain
MSPLPLIGGGLLLAGAIAGQQRFSRMVQALMVVAALALIAVGTGLVDPPNLEDVIRDLGSTLGPWTYALVGVMAFLETGAGIGLIAPGELAVILGGVAAGQGEVELVPLIALVWVCAVAGDSLSYVLGRRLGRDFLRDHGHRVKLTPERLDQVERYFAKHGGKTILFGRFIGWVRALAPFIAGASRMPARRFLPATIAAAGVWAVACTLLGYVFWNSLDRAVELAREGSFAIAAAVALGVAVTYAFKRWRRRTTMETGAKVPFRAHLDGRGHGRDRDPSAAVPGGGRAYGRRDDALAEEGR